jgi:hypothetical protein
MSENIEVNKKVEVASGKKVKAWKVKFYGTFKTSKDEIEDYPTQEVILPYADKDLLTFQLISRLALPIVSNSKDINVRVASIREVYIKSFEKVEVDEKQFPYLGKNIKELDDVEVQYIATIFNFMEVPLYKSGSYEEIKRKLYVSYQNAFDNANMDILDRFDLDDMPDVFIDKSKVGIRREEISVEIPKAPDNALLKDLKEIADKCGISYKKNISFNELYDKLYPDGN